MGNANNGLPSFHYTDIDLKLNNQIPEVYVTGSPYYMYKTSNFGTTWDAVSFTGNNQSYQGSTQVYVSSDLGIGDSLLTVGTYGLINKRNGPTDKILYTNFAKFSGANYDIWAENSSGKIWAVGSPTEPGITFDQIIYSSNGGNSWTAQNTNNTTEIFSSIYMLNSNTGYVVSSTGTIRKTINGGESWDLLTSPTGDNIYKVQFVNDNTGWIFGGLPDVRSTIYKTTNGAQSWVQQTAQDFPMQIFSADMVDENTGWIVGRVGKVNKTTNGGLNWISQNSGTQNWVIEIKMLDASTGYLCGYEAVRKTTNGGANWEIITVPFPSVQFNGMDFVSPEIGMLLYRQGTLKTTNGGMTWTIDYIGTFAGNNSHQGFSRLRMVSEETAFIGSSLGAVLKYSSNSPIGITEWQNSVPKEFTLFQNYPNPFNPSTTIKFAIPKPSKVLLKVFDITGREVRTLIDMELNAGTVTYRFDGSELASGVYFYSLYAENVLFQTRKMLIIK